MTSHSEGSLKLYLHAFYSPHKYHHTHICTHPLFIMYKLSHHQAFLVLHDTSGYHKETQICSFFLTLKVLCKIGSQKMDVIVEKKSTIFFSPLLQGNRINGIGIFFTNLASIQLPNINSILYIHNLLSRWMPISFHPHTQ
jgi:hypothetical protein